MMLRLLCGLLLSLSISAADAAVRVKDIANLKGVRENQILGYGLVIGLKGTGTRCATRRSPNNRCNRCSTIWASISVAPRCARATLPPSL